MIRGASEPLLREDVVEALRRSTAAAVGAAVEEEGGGLLLDVNGGALFESNSIQKLFTVGVALIELGPAQRFRTLLRSGGVAGELVLVASGDPTFSWSDLGQLCTAAADRGLRRVMLVVDDSRYDRLRSVPGWKDYYVPAFSGPLSAFVLDRNRPRRDAAYVSDPAAANGARALDALSSAGVAVEGSVRVGTPRGVGLIVGEHRSSPLVDLAGSVLLNSDSFAAELLLKEVGAHAGVPTTAGGLEVVRSVARRLGVQAGGSTAIDGSGLAGSTTDSPRRQVAWLRAMERSAVGQDFRRALPVAAVSGTLARRFRGTPAAGRIHAKTGTRRRNGTFNLAGYATSSSGQRMRFSFVVTGASSHPAALTALDAAVVALVDR